MSERQSEYLIINFYKSDVLKHWKREKDQTKMVTVAFPKCSHYAGCVWFWPEEWMRESKFNAEKYTVAAKKEAYIRISKSEKNAETGHYVTMWQKDLPVEEVKIEMRRPRPASQEEGKETIGQ